MVKWFFFFQILEFFFVLKELNFKRTLRGSFYKAIKGLLGPIFKSGSFKELLGLIFVIKASI